MTLREHLHRASLAGGQHREATANVLRAVRDWLREDVPATVEASVVLMVVENALAEASPMICATCGRDLDAADGMVQAPRQRADVPVRGVLAEAHTGGAAGGAGRGVPGDGGGAL